LINSSELKRASEVLKGWCLPDEKLELSEAEAVIRFPTQRTEKELAEALKLLVQAGVSVVQFREVASDLEDAFLRVARETMAVA
jgi:thiamine monophosphate synthase